jgi:arsenate reductase (glutaredoxin)
MRSLQDMDVTIYHNPKCSTSRNALAQLRDKGIEPTIVEYLKTPPDRATLEGLIRAVGGGAAAILRKKEKLYSVLGLDAPGVDDGAIIDAVLAHPVLIERPLVVTPKGARVCRPLEKLAEIL